MFISDIWCSPINSKDPPLRRQTLKKYLKFNLNWIYPKECVSYWVRFYHWSFGTRENAQWSEVEQICFKCSLLKSILMNLLLEVFNLLLMQFVVPKSTCHIYPQKWWCSSLWINREVLYYLQVWVWTSLLWAWDQNCPLCQPRKC